MRIAFPKVLRSTGPTALKIEVPKPEADRPRLGRVGAIALAGFLIGIVWPRLAGVKLVPSPPSEDEAPVAEAPASAESADPAGSAVPPLHKAAPVESVVESLAEDPADRIKIGELQITSCRDKSGARADDCGKLDLTNVVRPRILALASCPAAAETRGLFSLGLELDFESNRIKEVVRGRSTRIDDDRAQKLVECAKKDFASASLTGIEHQHAAYTVFYAVELLPPGARAEAPRKPLDQAQGDGGDGEVTAASGRATVTWEVALLRNEPKDGEVVARILRGTRVLVTGRQGDWYRIKYDAKGNEAWVFRTAIGL